MDIFKIKSAIIVLTGLLLGTGEVWAQTATVISPSNRSALGLEKNMLFGADRRYSVSQSGSVSLNLNFLFDGNQYPSYSTQSINPSDPYVLTIEGLPNAHVQTGAWVGWTTRHYQPKRFKMEVYNIYQNANQWATVADVTGNTAGHHMVQVSHASVGKIRITVYETTDTQNRLGLSEVFFLHPEAVKAYDGLMVQYAGNGNVGIGTTDPKAKLAVDGNILAKEIKVTNNIAVPDYVFEPGYQLPSLSAIEAYVKEHRHLPDVPSAHEIGESGLDLGEMNLLLLKKVEELTLHLIEKEKEIKELQVTAGRIAELEEKLKKIQGQKD